MSIDFAARAAELREQLNFHIYRYNVLGSPIITDGEYDLLYRELQQIEAEHPELITSGFTDPAGGQRSVRRFPQNPASRPDSEFIQRLQRRGFNRLGGTQPAAAPGRRKAGLHTRTQAGWADHRHHLRKRLSDAGGHARERRGGG